MRLRLALLAPALFVFAAAACSDILDTTPPDQLPLDEAVIDAASARAALAGAYNAVQSLSYYGGDFLFLNDLSADNAVHTGTLSSFAEIDLNEVRADNATIESVWAILYASINRANVIIAAVPGITDLSATERDQILGEAYFLRALHHHNLVKLWGDVPVVTNIPASVDEAAQVARSDVEAVYDQIIADLLQAEQLMSDLEQTRQASVPAAEALLARVYLYRGDWANAEAKANEVIARGFSLAPDYGSLFDADGGDTPEDIFRIIFTAQDYNNMGYYYLDRGEGGREELGLDARVIGAYEDDDERGAWSLGGDEEEAPATKFPTTAGTEHVHVVRFAEVLLNRAEALAQQGRLADAVAAYNPVRVRAGLAPHVLGVDVTAQQQVLDAIAHERRVELAFEGDRWADLVRLGQAAEVLGIPEMQTLYPVPQSEIDVAPNLTQNPGY